MNIGDITLGPESPPLVVAECGINHGGNFDVAIKMNRAAADAGADVVKYQTHCEDELCDEPAYPPNAGGESIQSLIKRCSFTEKQEREIKQHAEALGLVYISTPFSPMAIERLQRLEVRAYKIGSGDARNPDMLRRVAATRKPTIISTGMCDWVDIIEVCKVFALYGTEHAFLHCVSEYPTPYERVGLGAMEEMMESMPDTVIGLSDHSDGIWTALGAVALGAAIIEKHFRIPECPPGPDIGVSINPVELFSLVRGASAIWEASGGEKGITTGELATREWFEKSRRRA